MIQTAITYNIKVSVEPIYQPIYSKPIEREFVHAYRITIENLGVDKVQLLRRHWYIWDSNGNAREVEGEGVVGQQPILEMGEVHQYVSGCPLRTPIGHMHGTFQMVRLADGKKFDIIVPDFYLIPPFKYN
jgi:ApaG protein